MQQQPQQSFTLASLTSDDIQAIMSGLNELPSKVSRATMNKIEAQLIAQIQAEQAAQLAAESKQKSADAKRAAEPDFGGPGLNDED